MDSGTTPTLEKIPKEFMQHPFELYARLRREGPAREVIMPNGVKMWMVTRYEDVRAILADPRISKDGRRMNEFYARHSGADEPPSAFDDELSAHMLNSDPPRHERMRKLVSRAFTTRNTERLRPMVEQTVEDLLDRMEAQDEVDLISGYALALPIAVITGMLGVPVDERDQFRRWATTLVGSHHSPEETEQASEAMIDYSGKLIEAKRSRPGDDLLSTIVSASDDGDRLTHGELVAMVFLLVAAGHEATMNTLGNALHALLTNPDQLAKLRANPDLLHTTALDELQRYDGGVGLATFRFTKEEIPLGGVTIPAGEIVVVSLTSANRDEAKYDDPDLLDISRPAHGHLAFGHGIHYCVGAQLGKVQVETAIARLIARFPDIALAVPPDQLAWKTSNLMRGLESLPVRPAG
jgi:cytochrome P450